MIVRRYGRLGYDGIHRALKSGIRFFLCGIACLTLMGSSAAAAEPDSKEVRLVVLVVVDQLRADQVTRFERYFGEDGFRLLMRRGAHFVNAHFSYGSSATAPGHATIATGRIPRGHGIVGNKWDFNAARPPEYAVDDARYPIIPATTDPRGAGRSPHHLIGPTLGDQLKVSDARSRVLSVALKDRAAIFLGGHRPDGVYWWDLHTGNFVTSTYYGEKLPGYIAALNEERVPEQFSGRVWERMLPAVAYSGCYPVDAKWPSQYSNLGVRFPHALPAFDAQKRYAFNSALWSTPFGNDLVLELVRRVMEHEKPGQGPATDLLCVGFSSNDLVGHVFGPESPESMDMVVRTDRQLAALWRMLDEAVGLDHCAIALTSDHGVSSASLFARGMGLGGGLIDLKALQDRLNDRLRKFVGSTGKTKKKADRRLVRRIQLPWVYFNRSLLDRLGPSERRGALAEAAAFLRATPGVAGVFTAEELSGSMPSPEDRHRALAWRCYHPERSGRLYLQLRPYWYKVDEKIAGHTSGMTHDRHVPVFIVGPHIRPGRYFSPAKPSDIVVTLAAMLGIEAPIDASGSVLSEAMGGY
ncbi:MAG: alkaline phosphatase family protein [Phycisphaerae bacterium]